MFAPGIPRDRKAIIGSFNLLKLKRTRRASAPARAGVSGIWPPGSVPPPTVTVERRLLQLPTDEIRSVSVISRAKFISTGNLEFNLFHNFMSTLFLIRHAQASFFEADYDQLSPLGQQQAQHLGEFIAKQGLAFDELYTGPARRHKQTAELAGKVIKQAGLPWPEAIELPGFDEHAADRVLKQPSEELFERHPQLKSLADAHRNAPKPVTAADRSAAQKGFQKFFEAVVLLWTAGELSYPDLQPWSEFDGGVRQAITRMTAGEGRSKRVAAFTSVGPISVVLQAALETPVRTALHLGWRLRNCSVTEFLFTKDRLTLDSFNSVQHLPADLVTFR